MQNGLVMLDFQRDQQRPWCVAVTVLVISVVLMRGVVFADAGGNGIATGLHLLDNDAKVVAIIEVSRIMETPFGQRNMQMMMAGPQREQFLSQILLLQNKYGVNVLQDVYRVTMIAPFTDGEPFADVLFAVDAKLNKQFIEQALANIDQCESERHAGSLIFEVTNGTGKFFCSVISDALFVVSLDKRPIAKAIERAAENERGTSKRIADAINSLPGTHMAWAVADAKALMRNERDWVMLRENTEWVTVGVGIGGPAAALDATFQAPTEQAARSLEALLIRYFSREETSRPILGVLPKMIQPNANSISIIREGARVSVSAAGLQ